MVREVLRRVGGIAVVLLMSSIGCTEPPADPQYDNPLDPAQPGDPFNVLASVGSFGDWVNVSWDAIDVAVARYQVVRSLSADSGFLPTLVQPAIEGEVLQTFVQDPDYIPNVTNYYKVRAIDPDERISAISRVVAAVITPPAYVGMIPAGDASPTRFVMLEARSGAADTIEIDDSADFDAPLSFSVDGPDSVVVTPWTFDQVEGRDSTVTVFARARLQSVPSAVKRLDVKASFNPRLRLDQGTASALLRADVMLRVDEVGILQMRFADTEAGLAGAPSVPGDSLTAWSLDPQNLGPRTVYAEFDGDFGYTTRTSLTMTPAGPAAIASLETEDPVVPAGSDIEIDIVATNALEMRIDEDPAFPGVAWAPFATPATFTLGTEVELKSIYVHVRHDFDAVGHVDTLVVQTVDPGLGGPSIDK